MRDLGSLHAVRRETAHLRDHSRGAVEVVPPPSPLRAVAHAERGVVVRLLVVPRRQEVHQRQVLVPARTHAGE